MSFVRQPKFCARRKAHSARKIEVSNQGRKKLPLLKSMIEASSSRERSVAKMMASFQTHSQRVSTAKNSSRQSLRLHVDPAAHASEKMRAGRICGPQGSHVHRNRGTYPLKFGSASRDQFLKR